MTPRISSLKVATPFRLHDGEKPNCLDQPLVLALTHATIGQQRSSNRKFWRHVHRLNRAIKNSEGLIGHSIRREVFGKESWTMTVWRDHSSLNRFVRGSRHQAAIDRASSALISTRFVRVEIDANRIPLSWEEADEILDRIHNGHQNAK